MTGRIATCAWLRAGAAKKQKRTATYPIFQKLHFRYNIN